MKKFVFACICLLLVPTSQAKIITVDDDGPADFDNIPEAINSSSHGDIIVVKAGTYSQQISFDSMAVTLTSEDPDDPNVVQATIIAAGSGHSVSFDFGEGNDSILTGFTITGRGIHCYGTSPTISKNIIRDCETWGIRGENNAAPIISGNTISSNAWQGIYYCNGPITDNVISENRGGIAYCDGPITNNVISGNWDNDFGRGGALSFCRGQITGNVIAYNHAIYKGGACYECPGEIRNNTIIGNSSQIAGGALCNCYGTIINNIIAGNRCYNGGGGGLFGCSDIYNNTIVGNIADENGGALGQCPGYISNNIIAFNKAGAVGGIYGDCISSHNVFWSNEGGNFGGGATVGTGDVSANPLFARNGYWDPNGTADESDDFWVDGDYHVKSQAGRWSPSGQWWVKDSLSSPCIDAGDPNSDWTAELWPHGKHINIGAYGGTVEASMSLSDAGNVANLDPDANDANDWVDYTDLAMLTDKWLSTDVPLAEDLDRDGVVDFADFAILINNWQLRPPPPQAPKPDPMTWEIEPHATSTRTIAMSAFTASSTDNSGVEYYFDCNTPGGHDRDWQDERTYTDTGLDPDTEYTYRVKARNKDNHVETGYSGWSSARTNPAPQPPKPNPMTWATEPHATSKTTIAMAATIAASTDGSGVEYYFACETPGGHNSAWQGTTDYTDTGLTPGTQYTYRVKARNKANLVETVYSDPRSATTLPEDTTPPSPDPATWKTEPYAIPPASIRMVATTASDDSGVEYYFYCTSHPAHSSSWQDSPVYQATSLPEGLYSFVVRVRDKSPKRNTTADSAPVTVDLKAPTPNPMKWASGGEPRKVDHGGGTWDYWAEMTAAEATDTSGSVQYYFECDEDPGIWPSGFSSGWQSERTWEVQLGGQHVLRSFRVKARDAYGNETAYSVKLPAIW